MRRTTRIGWTSQMPDVPAIMKQPGLPSANAAPLTLFSVIIPARDEEGCIATTVSNTHEALSRRGVPHEIVVIDDGSSDGTWSILTALSATLPALRPVQNPGLNGIGRAIIHGLDCCRGDACVIMMADDSDSPDEAAFYWQQLQAGYDCVFGSRFIKGSKVHDYPKLKLLVNRLANFFIRVLFAIKLNDTTNAFKAYRRTVIDGCRPLIAPHFNLLVELPLKAIVRGYTWSIVPISWRNRRTGVAKLKIREMGSRYLFICLYVWLEKYFSRGDYHKSNLPQIVTAPVPAPETAAECGSGAGEHKHPGN
jgi:dolichol-phosphate mannosyltransferase